MLGSSGRGSFRDAHGFERVDLQTGRNHQAWKRTTAKAVGRLSEVGEFVLSVVASRSHRRGTRWQAGRTSSQSYRTRTSTATVRLLPASRCERPLASVPRLACPPNPPRSPEATRHA